MGRQGDGEKEEVEALLLARLHRTDTDESSVWLGDEAPPAVRCALPEPQGGPVPAPPAPTPTPTHSLRSAPREPRLLQWMKLPWSWGSWDISDNQSPETNAALTGSLSPACLEEGWGA